MTNLIEIINFFLFFLEEIVLLITYVNLKSLGIEDMYGPYPSKLYH